MVRGREQPLWIPLQGDYVAALEEILQPVEFDEEGVDASFTSFPAAEHCEPKCFPYRLRLTAEAMDVVQHFMTNGEVGLIQVVQMAEGVVFLYVHDEPRLMKKRLLEIPKQVFARWCIDKAREAEV